VIGPKGSGAIGGSPGARHEPDRSEAVASHEQKQTDGEEPQYEVKDQPGDARTPGRQLPTPR